MVVSYCYTVEITHAHVQLCTHTNTHTPAKMKGFGILRELFALLKKVFSESVLSDSLLLLTVCLTCHRLGRLVGGFGKG